MDIASISALVAAGGVIVGVVFAYLEIRNLVKTRQTELIVQLSPTLRLPGTELFRAWNTIVHLDFKDYSDFQRKYGSMGDISKPVPLAIAEMGSYFNEMGFLLYRKLINREVLGATYEFRVKAAWERMEPIIKGFRQQSNWVHWLEWFEYLYNEMQKREQTLQAQL